MRVCKKNDIVWIITGSIVVLLMCLHCRTVYMWKVTDLTYLINRLVQVIDCIETDSSLWFYKNDLYELGYGDAFFYGWLTLLPFIPVYKYLGSVNFLFAYQMVAGLVLFAGLFMIADRFTRDKRGILSVLFLVQPISYASYFLLSLLPFVLGCGLCLIFLSFCIDFFRDRKSFIPACIVYYIIFNTHLLSAILGFIGCALLFLLYFDKLRIKEYALFCLVCLLLCLWNVLQILYYISSYMSNGLDINNGFDDNHLMTSCLTKYSVTGLYGVAKGKGIVVFNILTQIVVLFCLCKKKSVREKIVLCLFMVVIVASFFPVWSFINSHINTIIQFPFRIFVYVFFGIMLMSLKDVKRWVLRVLFSTSLVPFFIFMMVSVANVGGSNLNEYEVNGDIYVQEDEFSIKDKLFGYIGNGEFLPSNMDFTFKEALSESAYGNDGSKYDFEYDRQSGILSVDLSENRSKSVEINKLWYMGYKSNAGKCFQSDNGYVEVGVEGFTGELEVWYEYPVILRVMFILSHVWLFLVVVLYKKFRI